MTEEIFYQVLYIVFGAAVVVLGILLVIDAPYGKRESDGWGPGINVRLGWFLLELPSFAFFLWFYMQGEHRFAIVPIILFLMYEVHYFHRTFIYPMQIKVKPGASEKIFLLLLGIPFNAANGYLNGSFITTFGEHLFSTSWLMDPRFIIGIIIFFVGFSINKQSDKILQNLRKPGETGYKIPHGGLYGHISCPNYFGELVQWTGFAIAAWSPAGLAFVAFTAANLIPRALTSHRWYKENFSDYPANRKAVIPGIL